MFLRSRTVSLPSIFQCRLFADANRNENFLTRKIEARREKRAKFRKEGKFGNDIDFTKVRCSLESKKEPEKKPQLFPDDPDAPIQLPFNPYERAPRKCLLCELGIKLDYKNARLLQQFVSSFSGRVYDRHVTGLCTKQHNAVLNTIAMSRRAGYMPILVKDVRYLRDPKLFDPMKPIREHSYDE